jgi:hypothetical protein
LAFRLVSHDLTRRLDARSIVEAAAPCGIQETPLGSAALAFLARVEGSTKAALERAQAKDRTLVMLWSVRGAPYVVPAGDLEVFSVGALPSDTTSFKQLLGGWAAALEKAGLDPLDTLERMGEAAEKVLEGRTLNVNDLRDRTYAGVPSLSAVKPTKRALLEVTVEPFGRLSRAAREAIEAEAERLAPFRDCETVQTSYVG